MSLADAFAEPEARYRAQVEADTFGHLAPKPRRAYNGFILFAFGCFGDHQIIEAEFDDLDSSPWFFDDINDFVDRYITKQGKRGTIYNFKGTYFKFKNGSYRLSGNTKIVKV